MRDKIRDLVASTGLSQKAFAEKYGIPVRTLQNWMAGKNVCPDYTYELLVYRVSTDTDTSKT